MASSKCRACGEKLSSRADVCPSCGAIPPKRRSAIIYIVLGLLLVAVFSRSIEMAKTGAYGLSMYSPF